MKDDMTLMNADVQSGERKPVNVLVLGVSGMLGNTVFRYFSQSADFVTVGSARSSAVLAAFDAALSRRIVVGTDVENADALASLFARVKPDVVINCIGLVKQLAVASDPLQAIPVNALLPHRLARLCELVGAKLVHVSTDCVFSGARGNYGETDPSDAADLYGRSKLLGEVDYPHAITLRTSIIGHELASAHGLVGWFLSQQGSVRGYTRALFSGLPTIELAHVIRDVVLPRMLPDRLPALSPRLDSMAQSATQSATQSTAQSAQQVHAVAPLCGLYHVAAAPIAKYDLLKLVAHVYGKDIHVVADDQLVLDRSLNAERFLAATGYSAPDWTELVTRMHDFQLA